MILGVKLAMIATLASGALAVGAYLYGHSDGRAQERAVWEDRENEALREANRELDKMHTKVREQEGKQASDQAQIVIDYEQELDHVEKERDRAVARVRSGELRMRDAAATANLTCDVRLSTAAASAAAGKQAAEEGRLSRERDEAAVRLLSEADELVAEVNECWAVVRKDRGQ